MLSRWNSSAPPDALNGRYLAKVIESELDWLDAEVSIPNSEAAQNFVASEMAKLPRKAVTLRLPQSLVERLAEICQRKRIVRDAFFNRLFLLLVADPKTVDQLLFGGDDCEDWRAELWRKRLITRFRPSASGSSLARVWWTQTCRRNWLVNEPLSGMPD